MGLDYLEHYGTPRHSGRYPYGSGENPYQSSPWLQQVNKYHKEGKSETEIAAIMGMKTSELRERKSIENAKTRAARTAEAIRLHNKGYSNGKIGEILGAPGKPIGESTIRNLLDPVLAERNMATTNIANALKDAVANKKYIDVAAGAEIYLGCSKQRLKTAVRMLKDEGYKLYYDKVAQLGTSHETTIKALCAPDVPWKEMHENRHLIGMVTNHKTFDDGRTILNIKDPASVDPNRVQVRYAEEGGLQRDGVIQLRRGVADLSLGDAQYAQVRIKVGDSHYLKGMAMYADDLPDGVDIMFNTNKHKGTPMMGEKDNSVLKPIKDDPDNPFGATVCQKNYIDADGNEKLSPINIVGSLKTPNSEGSWSTWRDTLSSQILSKQPAPLVKQQLDKAYDKRAAEFDEINKLTNPTVKKYLLEKFANQCESDAVDLQAAGMPRQQWHVILPFPDMSENEIYAPNYKNGEKVVLIRYPHAGQFEIPELTVNNKHPTADRLIHNARDAVGINAKVAEKLSGADFDGDTVLVIPNNDRAIKTAPSLPGLKNFDPKEEYAAYEGMKRVGPKSDGFDKGFEMGSVSNLITDMTIMSAPPEDIERAVKHSMVVIDAEKHNLDWKRSYEENGIADLKTKYQGGPNKGAATIISRASSEQRIPQIKENTGINKYNTDPETGERIANFTGRTYIKRTRNAKGEIVEKEVPKTTTTTKMMYDAEGNPVTDAFTLTSGTGNAVETAYAEYANQMKGLANTARKTYLETPNQKYDPSAKKVYEKEVASLKASLNTAKKNAPLERQAQLQANHVVAMKKKDNPDMSFDEIKRTGAQALAAARVKNGAVKQRIKISAKEWEAIQAGAITHTDLRSILANTDIDVVRAYATPHSSGGLSASDVSRAKSMLGSGRYTQAEVAQQLGVSVSTISNAISE